jgi:hypothetical protein
MRLLLLADDSVATAVDQQFAHPAHALVDCARMMVAHWFLLGGRGDFLFPLYPPGNRSATARSDTVKFFLPSFEPCLRSHLKHLIPPAYLHKANTVIERDGSHIGGVDEQVDVSSTLLSRKGDGPFEQAMSKPLTTCVGFDGEAEYPQEIFRLHPLRLRGK